MRHSVAGALGTMSTTDVSCSEQFDDIALFHPIVVFINFRSEIQNNLQTPLFDCFSIESTQTSEIINEDVIFSSSFTEGLRSWAGKITGTQYNYRKCNGRLITSQCNCFAILCVYTLMFCNNTSPYLKRCHQMYRLRF